MNYTYRFHVEDGELTVAKINTEGPLPELVAGNKLYLTVDGWSHKMNEALVVERVEVSLSYLGGEIKRYQVDVYCALKSF